MAAGKDPKTTPGAPGNTTPNGSAPEPKANGSGGEPTADELRIRRQAERIREMERLMRAAAAFARGKPGR